MQSFRYLFPAQAGQTPRLPEHVLDGNVDPSDIWRDGAPFDAGGIVVRDECNNRFLFFKSTGELESFVDALPDHERCFHEVIFGKFPQRIKFDIDASPDDIRGVDPKVLDRVSPGWLSRFCPNFDNSRELKLALREFVDLSSGDDSSSDDDERPSEAELLTAKALGLVDYIVEIVLDRFCSEYVGDGFFLSRDQIAVMSSMDPSSCVHKKFSFHVVVLPFMVADHKEASEFCRGVCDTIALEAPGVEKLIDAGVYNSTQNFRMLNCRKSGSDRVKKWNGADFKLFCSPPLGFRDSLISKGSPLGSSVGSCKMLPKKCADVVRKDAAMFVGDQDVRAVLDLVSAASPEAFSAHSYTRSIPTSDGCLLLFTRKRPSNCCLCKRTHHNEHSLMVLVKVGKSDSSELGRVAEVVELCRRDGGSGRALGVVVLSEDSAFVDTPVSEPKKEQVLSKDDKHRSYLARVVADIKSGKRDPNCSVDKMFFSLPPDRKHIYCKNTMMEYETSQTLVVKAQMGLGKTRMLRKYIDANFPQTDKKSLADPPVIRFVTFRQTFSNSLTKAFPDFTLYSDIKPHSILAERFPRAIVQVESLHRLLDDSADPNARCDLLVLDEVESVLSQFSSGLHRSFSDSFSVFQWLLATSKHVVCMDANVSDRTFRTLERMRPSHPAFFHCNTFSRSAGDTYKVTCNKSDWLFALLHDLRNGKRIALASNSLKEAKTTKQIVQREFPDKCVKLYSSETTQSEKSAHFSDVDTFWAGLDLLIYTPTVSAGVSFELPPDKGGYDRMYVYLSNMSCDVETARQMLGRVRALRDKEYCVCFSLGSSNLLPTDINAIEQSVYRRRHMICHGMPPPPQTVQFDAESGQVKPFRSPFFPLWVESTRIANLSRNNFPCRFVDQVAACGSSVYMLQVDDIIEIESPDSSLSKVRSKLSNLRKGVSRDIQAARALAVSEAPDISADEAADIRERIRLASPKRDVDECERMSLVKFNVRNIYNWHLDMSSDFVASFMCPNKQRVFRNLSKLLSHKSHNDALCEIHNQEREFYLTVSSKEHDENLDKLHVRLEHMDIRKQYKFPTHFYALWFLKLFGFTNIMDSFKIPLSISKPRVLKSVNSIIRELDFISQEFSVRKPNYKKLSGSKGDYEQFKAVMLFANSLLRKTYGVEFYLSDMPSIFSVLKQPAIGLRRSDLSDGFVWPDSRDLTVRGPKLPDACVYDPMVASCCNFVLRWTHEHPSLHLIGKFCPPSKSELDNFSEGDDSLCAGFTFNCQKFAPEEPRVQFKHMNTINIDMASFMKYASRVAR